MRFKMSPNKNLDSLKHYISGPTYKEKQSYDEALLNYVENETEDEETPVKKQRPPPKSSKKLSTKEPNTSALTPIMPNKQNINPENCLVSMFREDNDTNDEEVLTMMPTQQGNVINQMRQVLNKFQNATFNNCNFTFQMPK